MEKDNNNGAQSGGCYGAVVGMSIVIRPPPVWDISDKHTTITLPVMPPVLQT